MIVLHACGKAPPWLLGGAFTDFNSSDAQTIVFDMVT